MLAQKQMNVNPRSAQQKLLLPKRTPERAQKVAHYIDTMWIDEVAMYGGTCAIVPASSRPEPYIVRLDQRTLLATSCECDGYHNGYYCCHMEANDCLRARINAMLGKTTQPRTDLVTQRQTAPANVLTFPVTRVSHSSSVSTVPTKHEQKTKHIGRVASSVSIDQACTALSKMLEKHERSKSARIA